jgi:hypothetical protein
MRYHVAHRVALDRIILVRRAETSTSAMACRLRAMMPHFSEGLVMPPNADERHDARVLRATYSPSLPREHTDEWASLQAHRATRK